MPLHLIIPLLLIAISDGFTQAPQFPREVNLVFDYLLKRDYPETFEGKGDYQFRPISWVITDIDGDGKTEVFLQTFPHYTQSPTITVFQIDASDSVSRFIEGFAPGPLVAYSKEDDYMTPHSTGTGIDAKVNSEKPDALTKFAEVSMKRGFSVVVYKTFIHMDKKKSKTFIDLSDLSEFSADGSCAKFQFSKPEKIVAGKIKDNPGNFFIAKVGSELYCYQIQKLNYKGMIDNTLTVVKLPDDFVEFAPAADVIKYKGRRGRVVDLKLP